MLKLNILCFLTLLPVVAFSQNVQYKQYDLAFEYTVGSTLIQSNCGDFYLGSSGWNSDKTITYLSKVTVDGTPIWTKGFETMQMGGVSNLLELDNGNIVMVSSESNVIAMDIYVREFLPDGTLLWEDHYANTPGNVYRNASMFSKNTLSSGYILALEDDSTSSRKTAIWHLNNAGGIVSKINFLNDSVGTIVYFDQLPNGHFFTINRFNKNTNVPPRAVYILEFDTAGTIYNKKKFAGYDIGYNSVVKNNGSYYCTVNKYDSANVFVVNRQLWNINNIGEILDSTSYSCPYGYYNYPASLCKTAQGDSLLMYYTRYLNDTVPSYHQFTSILKLSYDGVISNRDSAFKSDATVRLNELIPNCQGGYSGVGTFSPEMNFVDHGLFYQSYSGVSYDSLPYYFNDSTTILFVYPNPFDDVIHYVLNTADFANIHIYISSVSGNISLEISPQSAAGQIDTSGLLPGQYYIYVYDSANGLLDYKMIFKP